MYRVPSIHRVRVALTALLLVGASTPALAQEAAEGSGLAAPLVPSTVASSIETWLEPIAPALLSSFAGNALWRYIALVLTIVLFAAARRVLMGLVMRGITRLTRKTETTLDDKLVAALDPPFRWFVLALGAYIALLWLNLGDGFRSGSTHAYRFAVVIIVGWALLRTVDIVTDVLGRMAEVTDSDLDDYLVPLVGRVLRVVLIAMVLVVCLQEVGFNVAGVLAGLGVGGLAFALAAQDTVANWFGALMIYTDRPFAVGDWVKTSSLEGVVEDIGLRSTRIRTFSKTVISVPNRHLADDVIENFSRMPKRRVFFKLGVTYGTTPAMMEEALERLKDILRAHPGVDQDFWLVKFTEFDDSALTIMLYFFTSTTDWDEYLSIRQDINLKIMHSMAEIGVEAAFPSRSVYVESTDDNAVRELDARARSLFAARTKKSDIHESHIAPSPESIDN